MFVEAVWGYGPGCVASRRLMLSAAGDVVTVFALRADGSGLDLFAGRGMLCGSGLGILLVAVRGSWEFSWTASGCVLGTLGAGRFRQGGCVRNKRCRC